jgi:hypothetical protein
MFGSGAINVAKGPIQLAGKVSTFSLDDKSVVRNRIVNTSYIKDGVQVK